MEKEQKITKAELARRKREEKLAAERERIEALCEFEKEYDYCRYICGIDEAGRGPLAGPVVAGAVVPPKGCRILYINDSKKLAKKSVKNSLTLSAVKQSVWESVLYRHSVLTRLTFCRQRMKPCGRLFRN